jgi:2-succinyl-5-enolpyruvyl-6-hydroxy-3-cyclohexene-1-carboxylate synthase
VLAAALPRLGVRQVVLCPGSRSAPLAYALAAVEQAGLIRVHVVLDERSAGFRALGLARGSGSPAVVVTTSGTAVANLYPSVLEASYAGVPLLVISADRPHELRGTGANQTADQVRMFGVAVRHFAELPAAAWPGASAARTAGGWRNALARAVAACSGELSGHPGPVQLNVAFAEPLTPDHGDLEDPADALPTMAGWAPELTALGGLTRVDPNRAPVAAPPADLVPAGRMPAGAMAAGPATVVLAGDGAGPAAAQVAAAGGWPLLSEPSSGARAGSVPAYRLLLEHPGLGDAIQRVIVFGRPTLSRPVSRLLARDDVEVIVVSPRPDWADAACQASWVLPRLDPADLAEAGLATGDERWAQRWVQAGRIAAQALDSVLDIEAAAGHLTGPLIARELDAVTGVDDVLVAGSSNPIRDLDLVGGSRDPENPGGLVLANRGLAGIDGMISTACGVALARADQPARARRGGQVRALVGDLTFLHDAGGLAVGALEQVPDLQIVVADDTGGSIFETLEQGELAAAGPAGRELFERYFATPQRVGLAALCQAYGVRHTLVKDLPGLRAALSEPLPGLSVVQVPIDRTSRRSLARRLSLAVSRALA